MRRNNIDILNLYEPCLPRHVDADDEQESFVHVKGAKPAAGVLWPANLHLRLVDDAAVDGRNFERQVAQVSLHRVYGHPQGYY